MTAIRFVVVAAFAFFAAQAVAQSAPENVYSTQAGAQPAVVMDPMIACYYKGIPYSEGAQIVEEGLAKPLLCGRKNGSDANPLVWK
jgi:hypothetical protein